MDLDVARPKLAVDSDLRVEEIRTGQMVVGTGIDDDYRLVLGTRQLDGLQFPVLPDKMEQIFLHGVG